MGDLGHEQKAPVPQDLCAHALSQTEPIDSEEKEARGTSPQPPAVREVFDTGTKMPPQPLFPRKEQSDELLVILVKQGNREAFEILMERYEAAIQWHIRRVSSLGDDEIILEISQETFLKAWLSLPMHDPKRTMHFRPWLYQVAITTTADYFRKHKLDYLLVPIKERGEKAGKQSSWVQKVEDGLCQRESIVAALNKMYPQYRQCLLMRYLEGLSFQAIANQLHISEVTVRTYISRGRRQFIQAYLREINHDTTTNVQNTRERN